MAILIAHDMSKHFFLIINKKIKCVIVAIRGLTQHCLQQHLGEKSKVSNIKVSE